MKLVWILLLITAMYCVGCNCPTPTVPVGGQCTYHTDCAQPEQGYALCLIPVNGDRVGFCANILTDPQLNLLDARWERPINIGDDTPIHCRVYPIPNMQDGALFCADRLQVASQQ